MKLDEKAIDKLIEELLQEKTVNIAYPDGEPFDRGDLYTALYGVDTKPAGGMTPTNIKNFAKLDGQPKNLSNDDFDKKIAKHGTTTQAHKQAKGWKDDFVKVWKGKQPDLRSYSTDASKVGDQISYDTEDRFTSTPTMDLDYQAIAGDFNTDDELVAKRKLDATTLAVFKAEIERHGDMVELFKHYETLSKLIQKAAADDEDAKGLLKEMDTDELFNSASVMATLTYLMNMFQGASAGTIFEVFLAFLTNGIVFGGSGAAADILSGKAGEVMISAKAYDKEKPSGDQSKANIHQETGVGETIWYVGLAKVNVPGAGTESKNFNQAKIFISGIRRTNELNSSKGFTIVNKDGRPTNLSLQDASGKDKRKTHYAIPFQDEADFVIEFATDLNVKMGALNFQNLFTQAVTNAGDEIQLAIQSVYQNLSKVRQRTQRYLAVTEKDFSKSLPIVQQAAADYANLKSDLIKGFSGIAGEREPGQGRDKQVADEFENATKAESKFASLDQLIAETIRDIKKSIK